MIWWRLAEVSKGFQQTVSKGLYAFDFLSLCAVLSMIWRLAGSLSGSGSFLLITEPPDVFNVPILCWLQNYTQCSQWTKHSKVCGYSCPWVRKGPGLQRWGGMEESESWHLNLSISLNQPRFEWQFEVLHVVILSTNQRYIWSVRQLNERLDRMKDYWRECQNYGALAGC